MPQALPVERSVIDAPETGDPIRAAGGEQLPVGRERDTGHCGSYRDDPDRGTAIHTPQADRAVLRAGRDQLTVRRDGDAEDEPGMADQRPEMPPIAHIPETDRRVL